MEAAQSAGIKFQRERSTVRRISRKVLPEVKKEIIIDNRETKPTSERCRKQTEHYSGKETTYLQTGLLVAPQETCTLPSTAREVGKVQLNKKQLDAEEMD
jgi:hypothetical protein